VAAVKSLSNTASESDGRGAVTLEADSLSKSYGDVVAVEGLSFTARAGEVLGLLGPNGAGKTTAIRVLTTIFPPTAGSFRVAGVPHTKPRELRGLVGVLPESAGYPEQQTGAEFLRYHARLFGHSRASAASSADALLEQVGLAERGDSRIATYSRGMRQRLGIARALVNDPQVVFFDEPTLGLDPAGQRQVLQLVQGIARDRGATVVLSTHFLGEVEDTCSRVLILNRGRVVAQGTVAEVTRLAGATRRGRFRVPTEQRDGAIAVLGQVPVLAGVEPLDERPDWLVARLAGAEDRAAVPAQVTQAMAALADAQIPVLAFELEGTRLSDAFLAMTAER
jgi:ABC-2 type transport system ATP-binding protein